MATLTTEDYMAMFSNLSIDARERVMRSLLSHPGIQRTFERAVEDEGEDNELKLCGRCGGLVPNAHSCIDPDDSTACMMCGTTAGEDHCC